MDVGEIYSVLERTIYNFAVEKMQENGVAPSVAVLIVRSVLGRLTDDALSAALLSRVVWNNPGDDNGGPAEPVNGDINGRPEGATGPEA